MRNFLSKSSVLTIIVLLSTALISACDTGIGKPMTREKAVKELDDLLTDVEWTQQFVQRRANIQLTKTNLMSTLPDISEYPLVATPVTGGAEQVEIFVSTEKSGEGDDGWMRDAAVAFNQSRQRLSSGKIAQVSIRKIASGTGAQFIASNKYVPQAFSPSNHLWLKLIEGHGVSTKVIAERTVGNVAGVVMKKTVAKRLRENYPELSVKNIIDAVVQGRLVMGYTNPYASSTGLNFLVSVLDAFVGDEGGDMLRSEVVSAFESFQRGIPFVAMTTLQMRDSVSNNGALDAFVMEYQTFVRAKPSMTNEYEFIPFGIRHDNPLYAVGDVSDGQLEVLNKFATYLQRPQSKAKIKQYGFDGLNDYKSAYDYPAGSNLIAAQKIWKDKKDAGRTVTAVFLADVSGSMSGQRIKALRKALLSGIDFISTDNKIGLVTFSDVVNVSLPPQPFNLIHKSSFYAAVEDLDAGGGTAMYNGILVSLSVLLDAIAADPSTKPLLFVLTDGETNRGFNFDDVDEMISALRIPVYSIAYAAQIDELKNLSSLVEASTTKAEEGNVAYAIGSLLNAQM